MLQCGEKKPVFLTGIPVHYYRGISTAGNLTVTLN